MEQRDLIKFAQRFKGVLSEGVLNPLGRRVRFCQRERLLTPYRLALGLLASCAMKRVESLADVQRGLNALFGTEVRYKPFHNQLAKRRFADFMRALLQQVLEQWTVRVLTTGVDGAFQEFRRIIIQDGSSFAVKDALAERYPGRFKSRGPVAVELHVTLDLLEEAVTKVVLTPDTSPERPELPAPRELAGDLLLADRGYFDTAYLHRLDTAGGHFVVRGYRSINPQVSAAFADNGKRLKRLCHKRLRDSVIPKTGLFDLDVVWGTGAQCFAARLIVSWNPRQREYRYLVTNLPRARYTARQVDQAYHLRWQIELLFKEWKSYANLHAFDTANAAIAEGLIWAAIAAAILKRYLAHVTQIVHGVESSTRTVAMCAHHVLGPIFHALTTTSQRGLNTALRRAIDYFAANATRAHPKRDRTTGRLQFALQPILGPA